MSTETEVVHDTPNLEIMARADLPAIWDEYRTKLEHLKSTAETLAVTDVSQVAEMKLARATRLTLKDLRCQIENRRKELVSDGKKRLAAIDASAKELKDLIEPLEARLLEQERFAEIEEAKRKAELRAEREALLRPLGADPSHYNLEEMTAEAFTAVLEGAKAAKRARMEAVIREEEERLAREKAEADERERVRVENERLKRERDEIEAKAKAEREAAAEALRKEEERRAMELMAARDKAAAEKAEADRILAAQRVEAERKAAEAEKVRKREKAEAERKLAAERAERTRLEAEAQAVREREEAARRECEEAERKAAAAPDREKLIALAETIRLVTITPLETKAGKALYTALSTRIAELAEWIEEQAEKL